MHIKDGHCDCAFNLKLLTTGNVASTEIDLQMKPTIAEA